MVLAFHVVFLSAAILIQGCRSTPPAAAPTSPGPEAESAATSVPSNWSNQSSDSYTPAVAPGYTVPPALVSDEPLSGPTPAERARGTPMRPDNPADFILPPPSETAAAGPAAAPAPTSHTVRAGESLWVIARTYDITLPQLRRANPKLKSDQIHPGMVLNLPPEATAPGQGGGGAASAATAASVSSAAATSTYTVRPGDNLSTIAARNGTTVSALREANGLTSNIIRPGQELRIPAVAAGSATASATAAAPAAPSTEGSMTVTLQPGETLGEIARRFDVTVEALKQANNITDVRRVPAGKKLIIPGYTAVDSGEAPAAPRPANPPPPAPPSSPPPAPVSPPPAASPPADTFDQITPMGPAEAPPIVPIEEEPTPAP